MLELVILPALMVRRITVSLKIRLAPAPCGTSY